MAEIDLPTLIERFGSEDKCHAYLEELRWPDGVECPRCGSKKISRIKVRRQFDCDGCRYQFSVRVGTLFHDSKLPSVEVVPRCVRHGRVSEGCQRQPVEADARRHATRRPGISATASVPRCTTTLRRSLRGIVEVDETYIGGDPRWPQHGKRGGTGELARPQGHGHGRCRARRQSAPAPRPRLHRQDHPRTSLTTLSTTTPKRSTPTVPTPTARIGDHNTRHEWVDHGR